MAGVENASRFSTLRKAQAWGRSREKQRRLEGAFVLSEIRQLPVSSELVAEADHVDHRVYVYVYFEATDAVKIGVSSRIDVDIANLGVDHQLVGQHIVGANLES